MACQIIATAVPVGPPYFASGQTKVVCQCQTHSISWDGYAMVGDCPVGKIEKAVEDGLEKIRAATEAVTV